MQVGCVGYFCGDLIYDLFELVVAERLPGLAEALHFGLEALAVGFLGVSIATGMKYERALRSLGENKDQTLSALRTSFDDLIRERFAQWSLSRAESDVALLAFRGLRISEIAALRGTREGTVKAQMSTVLHKAGVKTRAEFLAQFMDEFIELGVGSQAENRPPRHADGAAQTGTEA
jgi:DNA-binding CsgD family transcriptional regulator